MNGVKSETAVDSQSNFEDFTIQFKKRCAEVALDKIWLTPAKVWEVVVILMISYFVISFLNALVREELV